MAALDREGTQISTVLVLVTRSVAGDLESPLDCPKDIAGVQAICHICPDGRPGEKPYCSPWPICRIFRETGNLSPGGQGNVVKEEFK